MAGFVKARLGAWQGTTRHGPVWQGKAYGRARLGQARHGKARLGAWQGKAWRDVLSQGKAYGEAWRGAAGLGMAGQAKAITGLSKKASPTPSTQKE